MAKFVNLSKTHVTLYQTTTAMNSTMNITGVPTPDIDAQTAFYLLLLFFDGPALPFLYPFLAWLTAILVFDFEDMYRFLGVQFH